MRALNPVCLALKNCLLSQFVPLTYLRWIVSYSLEMHFSTSDNECSNNMSVSFWSTYVSETIQSILLTAFKPQNISMMVDNLIPIYQKMKQIMFEIICCLSPHRSYVGDPRLSDSNPCSQAPNLYCFSCLKGAY